VKNLSYWNALDFIRQTAEKGLWVGSIDNLMALLIGKTKVKAAYRDYLKAELVTLETAHILWRRGVDYAVNDGQIRFMLRPQTKPKPPFIQLLTGKIP
jgi:hypothetical protein